jgi:ferredoxin, 2Fe-2S
MALLRVEPAGLSLEVGPGETVLAAARRAGLVWRSQCGGFAQCRTCFFTTDEPDAFAPPEPLEAAALALLAPTLAGAGGAVRLACQAVAVRDGAVRKVGVRGGG